MESSQTKSDYSISMLKAQTASLPFGLIALCEVILFGMIYGFPKIMDAKDILLPWYFFPIFIFGIIVHEAIHAITWMLAARISFSKIHFGVQWKTLTPYAHCIVPIPKHSYVIGTLMPAVVLGFLPFFFSLVTGNSWTLIIGVLFTFAAIGDFLIIKIVRNVSPDKLVEDHPTNVGCFVCDDATKDPSAIK
jgi:hypothetical protein